MSPRNPSPAVAPPCPAESPSPADSPLLAVRGLCVTYRSRLGRISPALADIHFDLRPGEVLGVLGESGSGKTTLASALLRLLPPQGRIERGGIFLDGENLLELSPRELEKVRGARVSAILQEPSLALHPALRVGRQIGDVLAAHGYARGPARREKVNALLSAVFPGGTHRSAEQVAAVLPRDTQRIAAAYGTGAAMAADLAQATEADRSYTADLARIAAAYPHQLSGGQRQRVLVAQAVACNPALVIADEPTASLDATTQREILSLFRELKQRRNLAMIFITHNPALLEDFADHILVLYAGRVAELGPATNILESPLHPYTQALLRCLPPPLEIAGAHPKEKLPVIPGDPPRAAGIVNGCAFEPRCAERMELCARSRPATAHVHEQAVSCFRYEGEWN